MTRTLSFTLAICLSAAPAYAQVNPAGIKWGPPPPGVQPGAAFAVLDGDPSKPGPFVFRAKFPPGYVVPAHHHSSDEYVTVISGSLSIGLGDVTRRPGRPNLVAGGFIKTDAGMNHYVFTRSGAVIQVSGVGPFTITYVNPKDDPRNK